MPQGDVCRDAGNVTSLHAWAALAALHGIVTLDSFPGRPAKRASGSSERSDSTDGSNRASLESRSSGGSGSSAGSGSAGSAGSGSASHPSQQQPLVQLPSKRRMYRQLSMVTEQAEEEDDDARTELEYLRALAAMPEEDPDGLAGSGLGAIAEEPSAEGQAEEEGQAGEAPAAAATAAGARHRARLLRAGPQLLAAAAAAGLVPRPGSGCHLSCEGGTAAMLLHLDTIPFTIRQGATRLRRCAPVAGLPGALQGCTLYAARQHAQQCLSSAV